MRDHFMEGVMQNQLRHYKNQIDDLNRPALKEKIGIFLHLFNRLAIGLIAILPALAIMLLNPLTGIICSVVFGFIGSVWFLLAFILYVKTGVFLTTIYVVISVFILTLVLPSLPRYVLNFLAFDKQITASINGKVGGKSLNLVLSVASSAIIATAIFSVCMHFADFKYYIDEKWSAIDTLHIMFLDFLDDGMTKDFQILFVCLGASLIVFTAGMWNRLRMA